MSFTSLRGGCPICEGERKDCRKSSEKNIIFCLSGNMSPRGYKFLGLDKNQLFGMYVQGENSLGNITSIEEQQRKRDQKRQRLEGALSNSERDRYFRRIAYHLGLSQKHRELLSKRGFSDSQIQRLVDEQLVFSWLDEADIPGIPENTPGIYQGKLRKFGNRLAIAVPNSAGEIIGLQTYNPSNPDAKYLWISSEKTGGQGPQLSSGEMPIALHGKGADLWLCDSVGFKPIVAAQRHGIRIAGSTGGQFANRQEQIVNLVATSDQIIYAPDAGDAQNHHMLRAIEATYLALAELGKEMAIAWWGQLEKSGLDIDEVSTEQIRIISWAQWRKIIGLDDQTDWTKLLSPDDIVLTNDLNIAAKAQNQCYQAFCRSTFWDFHPKNEKGQREIDPNILMKCKDRRIIILAQTKTNPYQHFISDMGAQQLGTGIEFEGGEVFALSVKAHEQSTDALLTIGEWWKVAQHQTKRRNYEEITQSPTIDLSINNQFLPKNLLIDQIQGDLAIESITGSGKTTLILETQNHVHSQGGILIHLSFLDSALAESSDAGDLTNINRLDDIDWHAAEYEGLHDLCLNFQALFKLTPERIALIPQNSLIFIDEFSGAMKELAQASTMKEKRDLACANLVELIRHVKVTGGRVIVAQNRIFKIATDAFTALTGLPIKFIRNEYLGKQKTVTFCEGSIQDFAAWINEKRDRGISIMNPSSSQTLTERLCKVEQFRERSCLRLDKKTRDQHQAFYVNPTDYINARNPGLFSYTATWGLGGNLNADQHFDELIAAGHALNLESNVQAIARDRSGMDLTIFTLEVQPLDFRPCFAEQILYRLHTNTKATLSEHFAADEVHCLMQPTETSIILDRLAAQFEAMDNYERQHLKEVQVDYYLNRKHTLKFIKLPKASNEFKAVWEQAIDACIEDQTTIGVTAPTESIRDEEHAAAIASSSQVTYKMKVAAFNWHLKQQLPGAPLRDRQFYREAFIENDGRFYRSARLVWGAQNPEAMKSMERLSIQNSIDAGGSVRRSLQHEYRKCKLIKDLGILKLNDAEYYNSSQEANEIYQNCIEHRNEIQQLFSLSISPHESVTRTINKLVKKLTGYVPIHIRSIGTRGKQQRVYVFSDPSSRTRTHIYDALFLKASHLVCAKLEKDSTDLKSREYGVQKLPISVTEVKKGDRIAAWWEFSQKWVDGILESIRVTSNKNDFAATVKVDSGLSLKIWDVSHLAALQN